MHISLMTNQIILTRLITELTHLLKQPVLNLDKLGKALTLFRACINIFIKKQHQSHITACQDTFKALIHIQTTKIAPIFNGVSLSDWLFVIQHMILKQHLLHFIDNKLARELLFFSQLFSKQNIINPAYLCLQTPKTSSMIRSLIQYAFFHPNHPIHKYWPLIQTHFKKTLPDNVINLIYSFIFLPPNLKKPIQTEILSNTFNKKTNSTKPIFTIDTIKPLLYKTNTAIHPEDLLCFLLIHNSYTLIEIFTAILPLPWFDLANLMAKIPLSQKEFLVEKIAPYTINHLQLYSLISFLKITTDQESMADATTLQYWVDVCQNIHEQNITLMARRQNQIRYICQHPIGIKSLEQVLIHFKTSIENPYEWLGSIFIDQYTISSKDIFLPFTAKNHISEYLVERMFNPNQPKPKIFIALQTHYIGEVQKLIKNHLNVRHWLNLKWLLEATCSEDLYLNKIYDQAVEAFDLETDFTKVICYIRHMTEKNQHMVNLPGKSFFSEISEIDLACTLHPALST